MKRTTLLNRHLSALVARLGHLDEIVVADAGLPIPEGVPVIDLAISAGLPGLWDVLEALRSELVIEGAAIASEAAPDLQGNFRNTIATWNGTAAAELHQLPHDAFKKRTASAKAVVRTGECTPYANIILISGVAF